MNVRSIRPNKGRGQLRRSEALRSALAHRGRGPGSIWYVYSSKMDKNLVLMSDLEWFHFMHLEGTPEVESYELDSETFVQHLSEDGYVGTRPDALVKLRSGQRQLAEVKYQDQLVHDVRAQMQTAAQRQAALAIGAEWYVYTEAEALAQERFVHDWVPIVCAIEMHRWELHAPLLDRLHRLVGQKVQVSFRELHALNLDAWHRVFTGAFLLCQRGALIDDLRQNPLSWDTQLREA